MPRVDHVGNTLQVASWMQRLAICHIRYCYEHPGSSRRLCAYYMIYVDKRRLPAAGDINSIAREVQTVCCCHCDIDHVPACEREFCHAHIFVFCA